MPTSVSPTAVALVGAPNAGKTTLYNWITGSNQKTVNYAGSTVDYKQGESLSLYGDTIVVFDTPGTYSLFPKSIDEEITAKLIFDSSENKPIQGAIVVVDVTQFERQMALARQVQQAGLPLVVALTMSDVLKRNGCKVNIPALEEELGFKIVEIDGLLGGGVKELMTQVLSQSVQSELKIQPLSQWQETDYQNEFKYLNKVKDKFVIPANPSAKHSPGYSVTQKIDNIVLHPLLGLLLFFATMSALFTSINWLATPFVDWIDEGFSMVAEWTLTNVPNTLLAEFLANGVVAGFGSFFVFIPQIFILFFGLNLIEDSGYLARASSLVDKPLSYFGLSGRSFTPLLSGFACAVPAAMATRNIPNKKVRALTLFVVPLTTCSARLPVYALLLAFLFAGQSSIYYGLGLALLYFAGIFFSAVTAKVIDVFSGEKHSDFFVMELPQYRRPRLATAFKSALSKSKYFVQRAGPIIFVLAVVIWFLNTFPNYQEEDEAARLESSYATQIGQFIEPLVEPMGLDWRAGVGILTSFAAREVFVSSMAMIYNVVGEDDETIQSSLLKKMRTSTNSEGQPVFTTATSIGLLIFYIIALQCIATVGIIKRESGSWLFALSQLFIFNGLAYVLAITTVWSLRAVGIS